MKKLLGILFAVLLLTSLSNAAPVVKLDNAVIGLTSESVILGLYLIGSDSDLIDSASFTVKEIDGLNWAVSFSQPDGWSPIVNYSASKFGATDYGWPSNMIDDEYKFAEITLSWDNSVSSDFLTLFESAGQYIFEFSFVELSNDFGIAYEGVNVEGGVLSSVPLPSSLLLLGGGICALLGFIRRKSVE